MRKEDMHLRCPKCRGHVVRELDEYICNFCSSEWPVLWGIPCFNMRSFYWSQIPKKKVERMIDIARSENWRAALEKVLLPAADRHTYYYALDESRADWHFLLPIKKGSKILDLGCGWGSTTIALARYYDVIGADSTLETLRFLKLRAAQEGFPGLRLVRIDPLDYGRLPFSDSSFDLVVLNGVLEWVGNARTDIPPTECKRIALQEIKRVLKPGGGVYIGIENRFSYTAFLGASEHGNIPFADLMPRKLADILSKLAGKREGYRTYTYGYAGYKKLLSKAGFGDIKFYIPLPSYRDPIFIFPERERLAMKFFVDRKMIRSTLKRCLFALPVFLHVENIFAYSYGIFGRAIK